MWMPVRHHTQFPTNSSWPLCFWRSIADSKKGISFSHGKLRYLCSRAGSHTRHGWCRCGYYWSGLWHCVKGGVPKRLQVGQGQCRLNPTMFLTTHVGSFLPMAATCYPEPVNSSAKKVFWEAQSCFDLLTLTCNIRYMTQSGIVHSCTQICYDTIRSGHARSARCHESFACILF